MDVDPVVAFVRLQQLLRGETVAGFRCPEAPPFVRLQAALSARTDGQRRSPLDLAVLIRHALRHENARRGNQEQPATLELPTGTVTLDRNDWKALGMWSQPTERGLRVGAKPWTPTWLPYGQGPVDACVVRERKVFCLREDLCCPDPFLQTVGKVRYRTPGQRTAVRAAMTMRPGDSLLVCLPTGEGKSLVFDCLDSVGFTDGRSGVIVVVVPTVALALDHEKSARVGRDERPRAYCGGNTEDDHAARREIARAISQGVQDLCFVSPEAACDGLRGTLLEACKGGRLGALVIDEAHLVEGWGADFRTEYQLLSALRTELLQSCPSGQELRTILLSATVSQVAVETLKTLFPGRDGSLGMVYGGRLRPELQFFVADPVPDETRQARVLEALLCLPRPLVLYVSKVEDAKYWFSLLTTVAGFRSIDLLHGRTDGGSRERLLESWRRGELDMVVGTSAFGLGIDYPHVRAVVHACIPETMDRFYQEVGRGGRDGCTSISLLVPAFGDFKVASHLNRKKIITPHRGWERWRAMFSHPDRQCLGYNRHRLRIDVAPGDSGEDLDMIGGRSTDWNARVLTVMARAGMLRMVAQEHDDLSGKDFIVVELLEDGHQDLSFWKQTLHGLRKEIRHADEHSLKAMEQYIRSNVCPQDLLGGIYTIEISGQVHRPAKDCGGCQVCGARKVDSDEIPPPVPDMPWNSPATLEPSLASLFDTQSRMLVVYYPPREFTGRMFQFQFRELLRELSSRGMQSLFFLGAPGTSIPDGLVSFAKDRPYFVSQGHQWACKLLPEGPETVVISPDWKVFTGLPEAGQGRERLVFMPEDMPAPGLSGSSFSSKYNGPDMSFETFRRRMMP